MSVRAIQWWLASVFFAFDFRGSAVAPILTPLGLLDAVGNVVMPGACIAGYRAAGKVAVASSAP